MTKSLLLKYVAKLCLLAGFLIPLYASQYVGMSFSKYPMVGASTIILWAVGLLIGYFIYLEEKKINITIPLWIRICGYFTAHPATWVFLGLLAGYVYYPSVSTSAVSNWINQLLMLSLFVMGVQITPKDWKGIVQHPKIVGISVAIRWICMPMFAYFISQAILVNFLPEPAATTLAIGMVILGTTPTGAASNTLTLISRGDLALSVSVTTLNTLLAPFLQPMMLKWFVGSVTHVDVYAVFLDLVEIVLIPVIVGSLVGTYRQELVKRMKPLLGMIAVVCLAIILSVNISKGVPNILKQIYILPWLMAACLIHGFMGLSAGYFLPKFFGFTHKQRVASCFEVGVENASLSTVIAINHFSPLAALPAIIYGKLQQLLAIGVFVSWFQKFPDDEETSIHIKSQRPGIPG